MKNILEIMAIVPLLMTSAVAHSVSCRTILGTKSVARVPTVTSTSTDAHRPTVTKVTRSTTTTYKPFVSTATVLTTKTHTVTDVTETDTYSTTTTLFNVLTLTDSATVTSTETLTSTTSSTSTTVVPTTAGFHNIHDTLNSDTLMRRDLSHPHEKRALLKGPQGVLAHSYAAKVTCTSTAPNLHTKTIYKTLPRATKTIAYWSKIVTKTLTLQTTSTLIPADISTTFTVTSTSSVTTYTTVFATDVESTTVTTTSVLPGPTVFDACSSANIFGPNFSNGNKPYYAVNVANNGPGVASDFTTLADGASSAVDCCNACQRLSTCETFIFRQRNRNCFLLFHDGATCSSQFNHPNFILSKSGSDTGAGYVVGNGNCGYTYSGNSDGSVFPVDGM